MPSKTNPLQMPLGFYADLPRAFAEPTTKWVNLTPIYLLLYHPHRDKGATYPTARRAPRSTIYLPGENSRRNFKFPFPKKSLLKFF